MDKAKFSHPGITEFVDTPAPLLSRVPYLSPTECCAYVDLREFEDDRTVLKNPHKGWFWHYVDNGFFRPQYRADHDPEDSLSDFPGLNHLYLRYDWGDIEKREGHPDWTEIDRIMEKWERYGYTFSMRICAYEGSPVNPFATPEYVYRAGARGYLLRNGCLEPDYADPIFLEKLGAFLELAGRKFRGDSRIEIIDIGTFGTWGEGHTGFGTNKIYPAEVICKHIDLHKRCFPDIPILLNDDHINSAWLGRSKAENIRLIQYARTMNLGLQDDSVCVDAYSKANGYTSLRTPWLFDCFWQDAPIALEFEHYHMVPPEHFKQGLPFLEAMRRTHCTFAGFHGYPRPWLERERYFTEYCANRLGYWYFLNGYELPLIKCGVKNTLRLWFENRGFAPAYRNYTLRVKLRDKGGFEHTESFPVGNSEWLQEQTHCVACALTPKGLSTGMCKLYVGLFEGETPIQLAFEPSRKEDGYCYIGNVDVSE